MRATRRVQSITNQRPVRQVTCVDTFRCVLLTRMTTGRVNTCSCSSITVMCGRTYVCESSGRRRRIAADIQGSGDARLSVSGVQLTHVYQQETVPGSSHLVPLPNRVFLDVRTLEFALHCVANVHIHIPMFYLSLCVVLL